MADVGKTGAPPPTPAAPVAGPSSPSLGVIIAIVAVVVSTSKFFLSANASYIFSQASAFHAYYSVCISVYVSSSIFHLPFSPPYGQAIFSCNIFSTSPTQPQDDISRLTRSLQRLKVVDHDFEVVWAKVELALSPSAFWSFRYPVHNYNFTCSVLIFRN